MSNKFLIVFLVLFYDFLLETFYSEEELIRGTKFELNHQIYLSLLFLLRLIHNQQTHNFIKKISKIKICFCKYKNIIQRKKKVRGMGFLKVHC